MPDLSRRTAILSTASVPAVVRRGTADRVRLAFVGVNSRGTDLAGSFAAFTDVDIVYACDPDERAIAKCASAVARRRRPEPKGLRDFRRALEDPHIDAVVIAAPDHWHAPAAILACAAGKHVYVEKPASHNAREGELMVAAARKHNRVVQLGTQRRSSGILNEVVQRLRSGAVGSIEFVRSWYAADRKGIGRGKAVPVPNWLDWNLWQGPAPETPYTDNMVHYNWHWRWSWGTGELGNNGIHALDLCRWGLGVDYPTKVSAMGTKNRYQDDDQETPDNCLATFDFGGRMIHWEGKSRIVRGFEDSQFGAAFYGEGGTLITDGAGYRILDAKDKLVETKKGDWGQAEHCRNFLDSIRGAAKPNAEIEEGHKSTLLCHLGNISVRTGRTLHIDPSNGHIKGDREAQSLWGRTYRRGWEPRV